MPLLYFPSTRHQLELVRGEETIYFVENFLFARGVWRSQGQMSCQELKERGAMRSVGQICRGANYALVVATKKLKQEGAEYSAWGGLNEQEKIA